MEFKILGPMEVSSESVQLELGGARLQTAMATLLLSANKLVTMDRLMDAIYGERLPPTSRTQVQISICALRRLFSSAGHPDVIATRPNGYSLRIEAGQLDALRFEQLVAEARAAADPHKAVALYRDAQRLWRGPALHGMTSDVIQAAADRLDELRVNATEERCELELSLGRHRELVGELTELVKEYPLRERLCGQLILALHNHGRTSEALCVYRQTRQTLIEDLGLEPGEQLRQLHLAVLRSDPALAPRVAPWHAEPEQAAVPRLLPTDIGDFTGRARQTAEIHRRLAPADGAAARSAAPVAVVTGSGGVGKTAVAVHASHLMSGHFPGGQLFIDLHGSSGRPVGPMEVLKRFITALGLPGSRIPAGLDERAETYRNLLAGRRVLIVLDDAAAESQVQPLLPGDGGSAVLVTTRGGLAAVPDAGQVELGVFDAGESLDLLGRIAGRDRVHCRPEAAAIAEHCGHLPLALRIAGARLSARPDWSARHLADLLADESRRLDELSYRDMCVRTSISLTYERTGELARRLFRRLATIEAPTFSGGVGAALLGQSPDRAERALDDLVDARLIEVHSAGVRGGPGRYRFHGLVRAFARERLAAEEPQSGWPGTARYAPASPSRGARAAAERGDRLIPDIAIYRFIRPEAVAAAARAESGPDDTAATPL